MASRFLPRVTVDGSNGGIDIRDKALIETRDGGVVASARPGEPIASASGGRHVFLDPFGPESLLQVICQSAGSG